MTQIKEKNMGFQEKLAQHVLREWEGHTEDVTVVFPNLRSGLFFRQALAKASAVPVWAPEITTLSEFIGRFSSLQKAHKLELLFKLFEAYKHFNSEERFEDFFRWGEMLLRDFDEADRHLADAKQLFRNIEDLQQIDQLFDYLTDEQKAAISQFWDHFFPEGESQVKVRFRKMWSLLHPLYEKFREILTESGMAYEGMVLRDAVRIMKDEGLETESAFILFAGFHHFTPSEKEIVKYFLKAGKARIIWDVDVYYFESKTHEAGRFIRENIREFGAEYCDVWKTDAIRGKKKAIHVHEVPLNTGEAKVAGDILQRNCGEAGGWDPEETAVILPEESLLFPVLYALPESVKQFNVTMGYPLSLTPLYSLFDRLISLRERASGDEKEWFYHEDVTELLNHPYLRHDGGAFAADMLRKIAKHNFIRIKAADLAEGGELLKIIFSKPEDRAVWLEDIMLRISVILRDEPYRNTELEQEYLYHFFTNLKRFAEMIAHAGTGIEESLYWKIFRQYIRQIRIPFSGEPLAGLQVMGMLETRNLSFKNLIILSMNEGVYPPDSHQSTFIPYVLRQGFGLPVYQHADAAAAYYFYRLLQYADDIHLIWNADISDSRGSGKSRFILQLEHEPGIELRHSNWAPNVKVSGTLPLEVSKNDAQVARQMEKFFEERYLSPSAISTWLECKLKFYLQYFANLRREDEVKEEADQAIFGTVLHAVMEELYKPFVGKTVTASQLRVLRDEQAIYKLTTEIFVREFCGYEQEIRGVNHLYRDVIVQMVLDLLDKDMEYAPFQLLALEAGSGRDGSLDISHFEEFVWDEKKLKIRIAGKIDRLDEKDGLLRVVDYKTGGSATAEFDDVISLFEGKIEKKKPALQALIYSFLYRKKFHHEKIVPAIINTNVLRKDDWDFRLIKGKHKYQALTEEDYDLTGDGLKQVISDMLNPDTSFSQTENVKICSWCDFAGICQRYDAK